MRRPTIEEFNIMWDKMVELWENDGEEFLQGEFEALYHKVKDE